jgi:hypothetical protein
MLILWLSLDVLFGGRALNFADYTPQGKLFTRMPGEISERFVFGCTMGKLSKL